jgi:hypothetical protein
MKIRLKSDVSGSRDGVPWPPRGSVVDLPEEEAVPMCQNGMAVPVDSSGDDIENTADDRDSETRALTTDSASGVVPGRQQAADSDQGGDAEKKPPAKTAAPAKKAAAKPPAGQS